VNVRWLVLAWSTSCGGTKGSDSVGSGDGGGETKEQLTGVSPGDLRIDVTPLTPDIPPQTWIPRAGATWSDLEIDLAAPVEVSGAISGYVPTPTSITVPGEQSPIEADVYAFVPDTRNSDGTRSSATTGRYKLTLPAGSGYMLGVIPTNPQLPFAAVADSTFAHDTTASFDLTESGSVFGYVVDQIGGVRGARVQLVESETGIGGPVYETQADGYFLLHTLSGVVYDLDVSEGDSAPTPVPHVVSAKVWAEPGQNARVDVELGERSPNMYLTGHVVDDAGHNVQDVIVRATATKLLGAVGTLEIQTETDRSGRFNQAILPGHWRVELIPPFEGALSPATIDADVPVGGLDLDDQALVPRVRVETRVIDPATEVGLSGASVKIEEIGYDGYTFGAISDATGIVELEAGAVPVRVTVTPPSDSGLAVTHFAYGGPNEIPEELPLAHGTLFAGRVNAFVALDGGALLELRLAGEDDSFAEVQTDEDGSFSFRVDVEPVFSE
jgi:hypothetical protein